jgi:rfaE bifunctional protein nucleotidyltransferase chain/domain
VLAHGCFDLLHLGHIRHLQEARAMGDRLVVSVTGDQHVEKGLGRPRFTAAERVEALKALACVDEVFVNDDSDAVATIQRIRPAVYVKGADYVSHGNDVVGMSDAILAAEVSAVRSHGGEFALTKAALWSSSRLLAGEVYSPDVFDYLSHARANGFGEAIAEAMAKADRLKIIFVGERIIDEYRYVEALARPSKETIVAVAEGDRTEVFDGGVAIAAQHGEWKRAKVVTAGIPLRKTRFIDRDFHRKLFESYSAPQMEWKPEQRERFREIVAKEAGEADVVIALDFGHGLIDAQMRRAMEAASFFAVNSQTNAANRGFNPITLYHRADLVCLDDPEARLAVHLQFEPIAMVIDALRAKIESPRFLVTHGRYGAVAWQQWFQASLYRELPALATRVVDTMGAGDAFFAVAAPLVAAGCGLEAAAFAGSVAAAIKTSIVGHRRPVGRGELVATIKALLK